MRRLLAVLLFLICASSLRAQVVAFPGAQGAGAASVGGRGGVVFEVTNLNDSGAGSLRACVIASGPRTCVFRTGGTIVLSSSLHILNPFLTIAGQTAPGGGIQVTNSATCNVSSNCDLIRIGTHDVIIRYIRARFSTESGTNFSSPLSILNENATVFNVIFDHCSDAWGEWDNWDIFQGSFNSFFAHDLTLQWSLLAEPRFDTNNSVSIQISGANSSISNNMTDIDVHHNFLTGADHRNPIHRTQSGRIINNLVYNAHFYDIKAGGNKDIAGNYVKAGPYTTSPLTEIQSWTTVAIGTTAPPSLFISGNAANSNSFNPAANQWAGTLTGLAPGEDNSNTVTTPLSTSFQRLVPLTVVGAPITNDTATNLATSNGVLLPTVGASQKLSDTACDGTFVSNRDSTDSTFVTQFLNNTGHSSNITAPGTLPTLAAGTACTSTQHDGIADQWKTNHGLSTSDPNLYKATAPNGYTYLEDYLGGLAPGIDVYFAQNAAGAGNGTDCADAYAITDVTHGINVAGNWSPGNVLHVCATITAPANTNRITAQASGVDGSPIVVKFETNAILSSPFWPGDPVNGCSSNCGAIDTNSFNFITIDGGTNGIIQNTANGSSLANQGKTIGIDLRGDHLMVKNLTIKNLYLNTSNEGNLTCTGPGACPGAYSADLYVNGGSNVEICNNDLGNAHVGIQTSSVSTSLVAAPVSLCTDTQAATGVNYYNNFIHDHGWQLNIGGNGFVNIFNNEITDWAAWFFPTGVNAYHLDGLIVFGGSANSVPKPQIYNNYIHGDFSNASPSGFIFCTYDGSNDGSGSQCTAYNNLIIGTGLTATAAQGFFIRNCETSAPFGCGPHFIYNNTIVGFSTGSIYQPFDANVHSTIKNNIIISGGGWYIQTVSGPNPGTVTSDHNVFFGGRAPGAGLGGFPANQSLAAWQTASGQDTHSVEANPNLDGTWHIQNTSSPAYQIGANLASVGIGALDTGSNSTFGIGAVNNGTARPITPPTVPWDAGVYPFVSGSLPVIGMSPSPVAFSNQNVGTTSGAITVTVSNTGTGTQVLSTPYFTITGTNASNFSNAGTGTCVNAGTIAPSASCTVNITFTPSATGSRTATLTIQGTVFGADTLNGTGIAPVIAIAPSPVAFGNQRVATTSSPLTVTISNTGTGTETLANPFFTITGTNSADFARSGGTCANSGTIAASASCTIILTFTPAATGARTANLNILGTVNALASITGTGTQAALTITPSPGAFGNVNVGSPSSPLTVTVTNSGTATETLSTPYFTLTGTNAADFSNAGTGTCANGATIAVSGSCTVNLIFTPAASGARAATLTIQGTVNGTDSLTGTGIASAVSLSPTSIAFANQTTGTSSGNSAVVLTNTGTATLTISSIVLSGANAAEFSTNGSTCGANLAAGNSCTLNVVFSPVSVGSKSASLVFNTGASSSPDSVSLSGTGVAPAVPVLSLAPNPILFGNQLQNTTSAPITVTVSNTGSAAEVLATPFFTLTGTNGADFARSGGTCVNGGSIAVGGSCTVTLTFTPTATGSRSGILNILGTVNASDAISGIGILPIIGMSPSPAAFGNQLQGTTSAPLTVTVSNTGSATEVLATPFFTITGTNVTNFANAGSGTCVNGGSIAASSSCTIVLTFTPSATGSRTATLTIQGTVNATDALTGTGTLPVIGLAPSPAAFGNQNLNTTSSPLTVTVSNTGTATETLSTPFFTITGTNAANFARSGGTCANAGTIAASASCTVLLTFTPSATGARSATLNILGTVNGSDSLTGTGIASAVSLSPTSIAFGNQTTGTTSGNTAVTLTNTGTATLNISSIALTGTNASDFSTNGSTCGSTLAASSSCGLNVAFSPVLVGAKTASLTFTTDAASSPNNIPLTGTGTAVAVPALSFSPSPLAFGSQTQGTTSSTLTLTVTNTGTASEVLATPYFTITGANASSFANSGTGTCANGGTIVAADSCTILLSFTPSTTGSLAATLNVLGTVNGSNGLTGTGTPTAPSAVTLSPTSIAYGNQDDGTSSPPTQVSLTNTGTGTLTITSIALTGANATEFSINTNTCGASLAVSASCTWNVVFSPATAGSKSASVTVTTNAATSPDAVTLTGTGRVPTPPSTPAPAITIVNVLPAGSVLISDNSSGIKPRNVLVSSAGCSQDGVTYSNPCQFLISCGNCSGSTKVRWNGTLVGQTFANGVITASVPISLIPQPTEATNYQFSLMN